MNPSHWTVLVSASATLLAIAPATRAQTPAPAAVAPVPPPPPPPPPATPDVRTRAAGAPFAFVGGDRERSALAGAIERTVADVNFLIRGIARGRLTDRNQPYARITFRFPPGFIEVLAEGRPLFRSPDNGAAATWRGPDGAEYRITQRVDGDTIVQEVGNADGTRRNVFRISPDGHVLTMSARVSSSRLPSALQYALTYRR
jgi:hypothetical protein